MTEVSLSTVFPVPLIEPWISGKAVAQILLHSGHETYFVGGCVRDGLLDIPVHDVDLATAAHPDTVEALCFRAGLKTIAVGKAFGVIVVVSPSGENVEVATFRSDSVYVDGRRPTAVSYSDARTDVERRDFTINALLVDPTSGIISDYVGGIDDLRQRRIRAVGDATARLSEDRLRVLRAVRFAAQLDFAIEAATWAALCATNLDGLSGERLMQEWDKAMVCRHPDRWLSLLSSSGRLKDWCPPLQGIALAQTLVRLQRQAPTLAVRCAICLAEAPIDQSLAWLKDQPLPSERIQIITWLLTTDIEQLHGAPAPARWRTLRRGWPTELVEYQSCRAPQHPMLPTLRAWAADSRSTRTWKPMLRAADLMGLGFTPGPALGKALAAIEDQELAGELTNREQALSYAARLRHTAL